MGIAEWYRLIYSQTPTEVTNEDQFSSPGIS